MDGFVVVDDVECVVLFDLLVVCVVVIVVDDV